MSGGSYEYLCYAYGFEITEKRSQLSQMRDRLIELGYKDAAKETESILLMLDALEVRLNTRIDRLNKVWKAVEWKDSGDWGFDEIEKAINEYRDENFKIIK